MLKNSLKKLLIITMMSVTAHETEAKIIDVHSHYIGDAYVKYLKEHHAELKEGYPLPKWDEQTLSDFMNQGGISKAVLSLAPVHPYIDTNSVDFIRKLNEDMARLKQNSNGRYLFCATLPLTDVKAAVKEADYVYDKLNADAVLLGSNIDGQYLGDKELEPLMECLNRHKSVVIVHPHKPYGLADSIFRSIPLAMFEYPADTTRAVVNLVMHNVMARYKDIRFVIPHAGSFLGAAIPRIKAIYPVVKARGLVEDVDIDENIKGLYFDIASVNDVSVLKSMLSFTDFDHILFGSDFPYISKEVVLRDLENIRSQMKADKGLAPRLDDILYKNAEKLFK